MSFEINRFLRGCIFRKLHKVYTSINRVFYYVFNNLLQSRYSRYQIVNSKYLKKRKKIFWALLFNFCPGHQHAPLIGGHVYLKLLYVFVGVTLKESNLFWLVFLDFVCLLKKSSLIYSMPINSLPILCLAGCSVISVIERCPFESL